VTQIVTIPGQGEAEFPDNATPEQIAGAIRKTFPVLDEKAKQAKPEKGLLRRGAEAVVGTGEAALSAVTGGIAAAGSTVGAIAGQVATGGLGDPAAARRAASSAAETAQGMTYTPRTEAGKSILEGAAKVLEASKLEGMAPDLTVGAQAARGAGAAAQQGRTAAARTGASVNERLAAAAEKLKGRGEPEMVGVGAAETDPARIRRERAAALPVPIKLTKGQAGRTFEQQQFERETAKNPEAGKPLRERFAEQNQKILQNFDAWVDQTGAEAGSLRATGEAVTKAVVDKATAAKARIKGAYTAARNAGEMAEQVDAAPLAQYLAGLEPESVNAGVISAANKKVQQLSKDGKLSINDLEEVRKMVGNLGGKDATNAHFANEIKFRIDALTDGKGGDLYKKARSLHREYAKEFKNVGVVDKLTRLKPGTTDRAVAYEDVFQHSILKGSLDDVRAIRKTLQTGGEKGQQAWRELQGATIKHFKDEITKNVATDQAGNPVVSPAKLNALTDALDKDGKLDLIFGKKGAQQIRDVRDLAKDVYTAPPGSVNTSNTASILIGLLDTAVSGTAGMPLPIGSAVNYAVKRVKMRALNKRVGEALADPDRPHLLKDAFDNSPTPQEPLRKAVGE